MLKEQYRLTSHLQQKLTSLEDDLAEAQAARSALSQGGPLIGQSSQSDVEPEMPAEAEARVAHSLMVELREQLEVELNEKELRQAEVSALTRQLEMCDSLNKELDQAVADLQTDLAACKHKEEAQEAEAQQAQLWQARASQLEAELDAQVKTLQESVRQVTDSTTKINELERERQSFEETTESSQQREAEMQSRAAGFERELVAEQAEMSRLHEELAVTRSQSAAAQKHEDHLRQEHLALQQAVEQHMGLEADASAEAAGLKMVLEATAEKNMLLESTTELMKQEVDALENKSADDEKHIAKLQHQLETLEDEIVNSKKLQEAQLGTHADLRRVMVQTEDQLARSLRSDEMQQELTAKLRSSLTSSEVSLSQYRSNLESQEAMESQLRKQLDTFRAECREQNKLATDLRLQLTESEDERNASDTAFQTLRSIETDLRGRLTQEADQLSDVRSALQVQQRHDCSWQSCSLVWGSSAN